MKFRGRSSDYEHNFIVIRLDYNVPADFYPGQRTDMTRMNMQVCGNISRGCSVSIRLDTGRCLSALRWVAKEPGLLGFRASMAIQRWESGEWEE